MPKKSTEEKKGAKDAGAAKDTKKGAKKETGKKDKGKNDKGKKGEK